MNLSVEIEFINKTIYNQKFALKFHFILASSVIVLGLFTIIIVHLFEGTIFHENLKWILTLGGTFFSTLASFPVKEIFSRKDKVTALELLLNEFKKYQAQESPKTKDYENLKNRFWALVDKNLGG